MFKKAKGQDGPQGRHPGQNDEFKSPSCLPGGRIHTPGPNGYKKQPEYKSDHQVPSNQPDQPYSDDFHEKPPGATTQSMDMVSYGIK